MLDEEVVKGFNMASPYWKIDRSGRKDRMEFMDRCAELGIVVNFNLCSVAGGGGVSSSHDNESNAEEKMDLLINEIETFRDHPALLSWYIADEPYGQGVSPGSLEETYLKIKQLDPYHPVSMVFMSPAKAQEYSGAMDIVMADPYPVPHGKVSEVAKVTSSLFEDFRHDKPVWIVPQAFGGNEWWKREPNEKEISAMTWLALTNGATGIQYFIRKGLNSFPKSQAMWSEAGGISLKAAEIGPAFLLGIPENIVCDMEEVFVRAFSFRGELLVVAVNSSEEPLLMTIEGNSLRQGMIAEVEYENRQLMLAGRYIQDMIDGYGTRIYRVTMKEDISYLEFENLLSDPGFEDNSSPGIPSSCYARTGEERGATYFTDSRVFLNGMRSLRLNTPTEDEGAKLSFYNAVLEPGMTYTLSISAVTGSSVNNFIRKKKFLGPRYWEANTSGLYFDFGIGSLGHKKFLAGDSWQRYEMKIDLYDFKEAQKISPELELVSRGTAWFDELRLVPDIWISTSVGFSNSELVVELYTPISDIELYYQFEGLNNGEVKDYQKYEGLPVLINNSGMLDVVAKDENKVVARRKIYLRAHKGLGKNVSYNTLYSPKYKAEGESALVDGRSGSRWYKNPNWQGFEGTDAEVVVDLGKVFNIEEILINFLNDPKSWIFLPRQVQVTVSQDGWNWNLFDLKAPITDDNAVDPSIYTVTLKGVRMEARYVKVSAESIGTCPEGHPGEGGKAWLFMDEIEIR
jgi:hypothetical protein